METSDFVRQVLDTMTPAILQGQTKLTPQLEAEIFRGLKKAAVSSFATGNLNEAREINDFINSKPKFHIWSGNGLAYMQQRNNNKLEPAEGEILIYSCEQDVGGYDELISNVQKIVDRDHK